MKWFVNREGESPEGPYPLQKMANLTSFFEDTLVRREDNDEWIEAGDDPELEPLFESDLTWGKIRSQFRLKNAAVQAGPPDSAESTSNSASEQSDSTNYPSYNTPAPSGSNGNSNHASNGDNGTATGSANGTDHSPRAKSKSTEKSSTNRPTVKGYDKQDSDTASDPTDTTDAGTPRSPEPSNGSSPDRTETDGDRKNPESVTTEANPDTDDNHAEDDDNESTDPRADKESNPVSETNLEETDKNNSYDYDRPENGSGPTEAETDDDTDEPTDDPRTVPSESTETVDDETTQSETADELSPAGFWNRTFAFLTDGLLLGIVGLLAGLTYFDYLAGLGPLGRLIGFAGAVVYFGIGNSWLTGGRTLGKLLFGIRVQSSSGKGLNLFRSTLRAGVLGLPVFMFNLKLPTAAYTEFFFLSFQSAMILSVLGLGGGMLYLFLFNGDNRRSLHDYLADSVVLNASDADENRPELPAMPGLHRGVLGCWLVLLLAGITVAPYYLAKHPEFEATKTIEQSLILTGSFHTVQIRPTIRGLNQLRTGGPVTRFHVDLWYKNQPENLTQKLESVEASIRETLPTNARDGELTIEGHYGFDLGLARSFQTQTLTTSGD